MYKVPFILQFNFKHMKKGRKKLKLSLSKDPFLLNTVFMLVLKSILKKINYIKRQQSFLKPTRDYRGRIDKNIKLSIIFKIKVCRGLLFGKKILLTTYDKTVPLSSLVPGPEPLGTLYFLW